MPLARLASTAMQPTHYFQPNLVLIALGRLIPLCIPTAQPIDAKSAIKLRLRAPIMPFPVGRFNPISEKFKLGNNR